MDSLGIRPIDAPIKSHRDLIVWQKAMALTVEVYQVTKAFPKEELYGLTSQLRRASSSIAANIAEGKGRRTDKEFQHFLVTARGSLMELDTHLELAVRINYLTSEVFEHLRVQLIEVGKTLNGLIRSLG
jgi:four helix bundle protein